jgi:hydrogenase-4 component E
MESSIVLGIIIATYLMVIAKRITALVRSFAIQSFFLFLYTLVLAKKQSNAELYVVAGLLFCFKVVIIPYSLNRIARKIKVNENLGLFLNAGLSLFFALICTYGSWVFSRMIVPMQDTAMAVALTASFTVTLTGMFLMVSRMKALSQTVGLLVMENGIFLLAASISGGMPFFVELAIFLDILLSVIILNIFVWRINKMFTHVDAAKLNRLKG